MKEAFKLSCGIYKFENKINGMIYIGQAIDLQERYKKHLKNINDLSHQEDFYIGLREFGINNFSYEILESFNEFNQDFLNSLECFYIEKFNCLVPNGYNMVPGGSNGAGLAKGKRVIQFDLKGKKIAEYPSAHEASRITGIDCSSICACCRNEISHTKIFQWKYDNDNKIIQDISTSVILMDQPVLQYSLDGVFIKEYLTLQQASEITNISKSTICNVCNGKGNTAGGYIWRYKINPLKSNESIKTKNRAILQFDKQGNFIKEFESITQASKETNTNLGNIQQVCAGKRKTANKYIWKYK